MTNRLICILFILLLSFSLFPSYDFTIIASASEWQIDGNKVFVNNTNVYLSAQPHTIIQDTWVTFKLRSKGYEGDIDACWLFNTTNCKPTKPVYYKVGDGDWQTLTKEFTIETIDFENMTKAYLLENINIQKDVNYSLKCFVDIKFNTSGKYWWGVKPSVLGWANGYYIDPWWNSNWNYSKRITIDHTKVASDLTNFPVLIQNTSDDFKNYARSDGYDFRFIDSTHTTEYHWELENYDSATGNLTAWVNITSLSSSVDTVFYCYYNNSDADTNPSSNSTWDSYFKMVQHMDDNPNTSRIKDSTNNSHEGTKTSAENPIETSGKIENAQSFSSDKIRFPDSVDWDRGEGDMTASCWIKLNNIGKIQQIFGKNSGVTYYPWGVYINSTNYLHSRVTDTPPHNYYNSDANNHIFTTGTWYLVYATINRSDDHIHLYVDGQECTYSIQNTISGTAYTNNVLQTLGATGDQNSNFLDGIMDEFRWSKGIARNASWISTAYNSQSSPSTFMSIRVQQSLSPQTNTTIGIELTNATLRGYLDFAFDGNYNYGFWIGQTTPVTEANADQNVTGVGTITAPDKFSYNVSSLSKGTHYYVTAWASNATHWGTGNEVDFYTKCDVPTGFTATLDDCYADLAWTKGTGADKTTIIRKVDSYPANLTDGTVIYNNTASSYSDTTGAGSHQYYRAWSWTGDKHSDENATANLIVPPCPPTSVTGEILVNSTLKISWTKGTGADTTLVVRKIDSSPSSVTDGTVMYNSTGTYYVATDLTENYFYRLWSYANETYSTSVALDFGALVINTYSEETNDSLYFDVLVRNESGTQSYESQNNTNPLVINVVDNLPLGDNIRIIISAASNYSEKSETFTYPYVENATVTYVILLQVPESKSTTNVTCMNESAGTNSYPAFTLDADVITILADAADEFNRIYANYTHYEYDRRTYYRDLVGNHVYILDAFLPDADVTELYVLQVIDDYDIPVEGADLEIKRSVNGTYETITSPITDANGKVSVYLTPSKDHLVTISKSGFETKNASFIPDPDYYGSYYPMIFRITYEEEEIEPETVGDYVTITGTLYANDTLNVTYYEKADETINTHFYVYEQYNNTLTYIGEYNGTTSNDFEFWKADLNTSRIHLIVLFMNHTTLGAISNYTVYVMPLHEDKESGQSLETHFISVGGNWEYGWVNTLIWYLPCIIFIMAFATAKHPGMGVMFAGMYCMFVSWYLYIPDQANLVMFASIAVIIGMIGIFLKRGRDMIH